MPAEQHLANELDELAARLTPGAAVMHRLGKQYPDEPLPRWSLDVVMGVIVIVQPFPGKVGRRMPTGPRSWCSGVTVGMDGVVGVAPP